MPGSFDEDQARFIGALALGDYFASWEHRCAFTGESLQGQIDADPMSALLRLVPQVDLRADLILPASADAQSAYTEGALRVGPDLNLILIPGALTQLALIGRLNPDYRLRLPLDMAFAPNMLVLRDQCRALLDPRA
jgi:hypothetical protein